MFTLFNPSSNIKRDCAISARRGCESLPRKTSFRGEECAAWEVRRLLGQQTKPNILPREALDVHTKSHAGSQYFVTFIDDYSRKLWAFVLKTNDQVLFFFKKFQARISWPTNKTKHPSKEGPRWGRKCRLNFCIRTCAMWIRSRMLVHNTSWPS